MTRAASDFANFPKLLAALMSQLPAPYGPYRAVSRFDTRYDDGDTSLFLIDLGFDQYSIASVRFLGINAPETSTAEGRSVRDLLATHFVPAGTPVLLVTSFGSTQFGRDRYGRLLAAIIVEVRGTILCLNKELLDRHLAVPYMGEPLLRKVLEAL